MTEKHLYRSCENRIIGGVCGGLGEYFDIDPILIRLIVALLFFTGLSIIFYILAWIIIPEDPNCDRLDKEETKTKASSEVRAEVKGREYHYYRNDEGRITAGLIVVAIGVLFLLQNTMGIRVWEMFWPFILIVIGLLFIFKTKK